MKTKLACILILWMAFPIANAQTFQVVPAQTTIVNNGTGYANILSSFCTHNGPLNPTNNNNVFLTNVSDFDFWAGSWFNAKVTSDDCPVYVAANNRTFVRIKGDGTNTLTTDWWHACRSHCIIEAEYSAWAKNYLDFTVAVEILPGGGYNPGDPITVYYQYDIFASGMTKHESSVVDEDIVTSKNQFFLDGDDVLLPYIFNFNDPPGFSGWNRRQISGVLNKNVGDTLKVSGISTLESEIDIPGSWLVGIRKDKTTAYFSGNIEFSIVPIPEPNINPKVEFTVDIGSDSELSDPVPNGNEVFDPGDTYLMNGPFMVAPQDGIRNDAMIFGTDPSPDPIIPGTGVPCGSGDFTPLSYFEVDGFDILQKSLVDNFPFGPDLPSIEYFTDSLILYANHFLVSYDDDYAENWSYNLYSTQAVPVNSGSTLLDSIYGKSIKADEVVALDLDAYQHPSIPISIDSLWKETDIHPNFNPNPDTKQSEDDDVNGLKYFIEENLDGYYYFSVDNEATFTYPGLGALDPAAIYEMTSIGIISKVIDPVTHLGLLSGTDINAFTFGWIWDDQQERSGLALLFSVDADDWTTQPDESGGLDPTMIYYSFLNGSHADYMTEGLDDNIDALTLVPYSFNGYSLPSPDLPDSLELQDVGVTSGQTECYNASGVIIVAGDGTTFNVESGASATMIAGEKISYLPGTSVQYGGYMHGYIAPTGPWCTTSALSVSLVAATEDETSASIDQSSIKDCTIPTKGTSSLTSVNTISFSSFKVYPNPTKGIFTLEFNDGYQPDIVSVEIYGMRGEKVLTETLYGKCKHEFSLANRLPGIYLIKVITNNKSETAKVIKH